MNGNNRVYTFFSSLFAGIISNILMLFVSAASLLTGGAVVYIWIQPPGVAPEAIEEAVREAVQGVMQPPTISAEVVRDAVRASVAEVIQPTISTEAIQNAARGVAREIVDDAGTCAVALYVEIREQEPEEGAVSIPSECSAFRPQASTR